MDVPNQLTGHTAQLTATSSFDVGPTPYFIQIYDTTTGTKLKDCPTGRICSVGVRQPAPIQHRYRAYTARLGTTSPPPDIQVTAVTVTVTWLEQLVLNANPMGGINLTTSTLTATSGTDVGPTPNYIQIYDTTTGARLQTCGQGTVCSVNVSPSRGKNNYIATIGALAPRRILTVDAILADRVSRVPHYAGVVYTSNPVAVYNTHLG